MTTAWPPLAALAAVAHGLNAKSTFPAWLMSPPLALMYSVAVSMTINLGLTTSPIAFTSPKATTSAADV